MKSTFLLFGLGTTLVGIQGLVGQAVEYVFVDRSVIYTQDAPFSVKLTPWEAPYNLMVGIVPGDGITAGHVSNGATINADLSVDGNEVNYLYEAANETTFLNQVGGSATYTITGSGSTVGNFSIPISVGTYNPITVGRYTNYNELSDADLEKPLTVRWESIPGMDFVSVWADNNDGDMQTRLVEEEELDPTATSFTIPGGTLKGNPDDSYSFWVRFTRIDSMVDSTTFSGAQEVAVTSLELSVQIKGSTQTTQKTWAGYPWANESGDVNTTSWVGWINVVKKPWLYSYSLKGWLYLPESAVTNAGAWVYLRK